jgi:pimeloyl-ACP methyl ester carboxylesterase
MPTVLSNGIRLYYEKHGRGQPLLLIAGVGQGVLFWRLTLLPLLTPYYEVILFDNRGMGDSENPADPFTVEIMAEDTRGLMRGLGLNEVAIIGHSLGGAIGFELAKHSPEQVKKLVMMSALYPGPQAVPPSPRALEVLTSREGDLFELIQRGIRIATAPEFEVRNPHRFSAMVRLNLERTQSAEMYLKQSQAGLFYLMCDRFADTTLTTPTLLLYGEDDEVTPAANGVLIQEKIAASQLIRIPKAGHLLPLEQTAACVQAIRAFIPV